MTNTSTTYPHYTMLIAWSDEDQASLVTLPEWAGRVNIPTTHSTAHANAAANSREALAHLIAIAQARGQSPHLPRIYAGV